MSSRFDRILDRVGLVRKASILPEYHMDREPKARTPDWNLVKLYDIVSKSWVLQEIFRAIIQEVKRPGWRIEPRFKLRCDECGAEYLTTQERCTVCGSRDFSSPDQYQRQRALKLMKKPNSRRQSFGDIIGNITYHDLVADDWYLSIEYASLNSGAIIPAEIRIQHPQHIKPVVDEYGNFGNPEEWFCPVCFDYQKHPKVYSKIEYQQLKGTCPNCSLQLQMTAYIQEVTGEVKARWGFKQMVHGSTHAVLPGIFGTPRAKSLWQIIHVLLAMDEWFLDTFREGRLQKIVNFPGYDQVKLTELMRRIQAELTKLRILDERTGELRTQKKLRTLFLASETPLSVHDVGISPEEIQLLDYYRICIHAVAGVYGVQAIFISYIEKGKAGTTPAMQIEVQNRTIQEIQRDKEEVINEQLFPIFGITDWLFKFNQLEKRDASREAEIRQRDAATALTLRRAGFDVWWDEFGQLKWSSRPTRPIESRRPTGTSPPKRKVSGASGMEIEGTTTEREPHGPRPPTQQDEERER